MLKNLGNNIAKLRRSADITQEQLAEQLNVSVSAVSQWENGKTLPDISAIPVLCHVFSVSSDELLGIDHEKDEEEIKRISDEAHLLMSRAHKVKAEKVLLEGLKRFPNSYELMEALMFLYYNLSVDNDTEEEKKKQEKYLRKCNSSRFYCHKYDRKLSEQYRNNKSDSLKKNGKTGRSGCIG